LIYSGNVFLASAGGTCDTSLYVDDIHEMMRVRLIASAQGVLLYGCIPLEILEQSVESIHTSFKVLFQTLEEECPVC